MFVYTARLTKTKLAIAVGAVCLLLVGIIAAVTAIRSPAEDALGPADKVSLEKVKTNEERVELLKNLGWEVKADPSAVEEVVIPQTFDDVYGQYNELQTEQGLDLTKYQGKTVKRYTYQVTNYPGEGSVNANLLIYKNRLIGGDVCSTQFQGFMHGLTVD